MTTEDEHELHRLTNLLERIDRKIGSDPELHEALQKAALALSVSFVHGLRPELEKDFEMLAKPLTESQRAHLKSLGIDAD